MKTLKVLLPLLALVLGFTACSKDDDNDDNGKKPAKSLNVNANNSRTQPELARLEFPKVKGGSSLVIIHNALLNPNTGERGVNYSTEWDASKHAQRWSCYQLYESIRNGNTSRYQADYSKGEVQYPHDEFLSNEYQLYDDPYWGSGYDHGHICPSADRLCSFEANYQTFFLSNMQPQLNGFNAKVWANMENMVRTWNRNNFRDTLYVCKGGTIDSEANIMRYIGSGASRIPVPRYFFMALLCKNTEGYKAMAFWIEHKAGTDDGNALKQYVISIDELEQLTDIDFFCNLPDDVEERVEKNVYPMSWGFK